MTKEQAMALAEHDKDYRVRKLNGQWVVWSKASDHVVEFDTPEKSASKGKAPTIWVSQKPPRHLRGRDGNGLD